MSEQTYRMSIFDSGRGMTPKAEIQLAGSSTKPKEASQGSPKKEGSEEGSQQNFEINISLFKRFAQFLLNQKLLKLSTALKRHCGRHFPIGYRPEFGFNEFWQDQKTKTQQSSIIEYFQYPQWYYHIYALLILLSKISLIWTISIHRLYKVNDGFEIYNTVWGILTMLCDFLLQYQLFEHCEYFKQKQGKVLKYVKAFWKDVLLFVYFVMMPVHYDKYEEGLLLVDVMVALVMSKRCEEIKRSFHMEITSTSYKDAYNVFELFSTLLPIAHIFALTLYYTAMCNKEKNWLNTHNLINLTPLQEYVYSLYFAFTTMLTVGYGDLTPANVPQILIVITIQIIGIITYGYIVNEIGHIIGNMRKEDELLSRDISTISKMAKYYSLDKTLVDKAKNFLVCQKKQIADLTPEEQQRALSKLHDDLREQISRQNYLKILKSSLFYVCNWTKKFQIQIAKKIHKKVFSPSQQILQVPNKQRIYIFKKGKVQIHANRSQGYKKHFKKILRVIEPKQTMEVSDNIYGYSFIMSNTPIKLSAVNKEFVVAYYVERKDFLQTVMNSHVDSEYYFQMKTKIDSVSYPESWEAPLIINTKEHYFPNIQYLIKKYKSYSQKEKNVRKSDGDFRRLNRPTKRIFYRTMEEMQGECITYNIPENLKTGITTQMKTDKVIGGTNRNFGTLKSIENYQYAEFSHFSSTPTNENMPFRKQSLHFMFEQSQEYSIYFRRFNRTEILMKMENSNYMLKQKRDGGGNKDQSTEKNDETTPSIMKESILSLEI